MVITPVVNPIISNTCMTFIRAAAANYVRRRHLILQGSALKTTLRVDHRNHPRKTATAMQQVEAFTKKTECDSRWPAFKYPSDARQIDCITRTQCSRQIILQGLHGERLPKHCSSHQMLHNPWPSTITHKTRNHALLNHRRRLPANAPGETPTLTHLI